MGRIDTWFISDTHFGHDNVIRYCDRPFKDSKEMDEYIISQWNKKVKPNDIIWHLGDVAMKCNKQYLDSILKRLNGRKYLILGNHDKLSTGFYKKHFEIVLNGAIIKIGKQHVNLSHYPYKPGILHNLKLKLLGVNLRHIEKRLINNGNVLIHGHIHNTGNRIILNNMINVSCDMWGFSPVNLNKIFSLISKMECK